MRARDQRRKLLLAARNFRAVIASLTIEDIDKLSWGDLIALTKTVPDVWTLGHLKLIANQYHTAVKREPSND